MAYDEQVADRVRELLAGDDRVTEKKMFGGLAFLLNGHMAVSASRNGGLLVRVDPADAMSVLQTPHTERMQMGGRAMDGWITVAPKGVKTKRQVSAWVARGITYATTLPPK